MRVQKCNYKLSAVYIPLHAGIAESEWFFQIQFLPQLLSPTK